MRQRPPAISGHLVATLPSAAVKQAPPRRTRFEGRCRAATDSRSEARRSAAADPRALEIDLEAAVLRGAEPQVEAVELGDAQGDVEAQAEAIGRARACGVAAEPALDEPRELVGRNARAVVDHAQ